MRCVSSVSEATLNGQSIQDQDPYPMNNLQDFVESLIYHQLGIVPLSYDDRDINRILASLPPEEALQMKRKFRKLWRKASVIKPPSPTKWGRAYATRYKEQMGYGEAEPTKKQKRNRKWGVMRNAKIKANSMLNHVSGESVKELHPWI